MCGINGLYLAHTESVDGISRKVGVMNRLLKHRGPDDDGIWIDHTAKVGLGHTRLSIIDLSTNAHQPFRDDYNNVLVFNGEIYNYIELREQLRINWTFRTESDTEVILAAYHAYGKDCVKHFEGMFAFALWDNKEQSLFLARDRIGIKPLYYLQANNNFYFASETKALLPFIDELKLNKVGLAEYLVFQYPLKEDLLFADIKQVLPGNYIVYNKNKLHKVKYWDLKYSDTYRDAISTKDSFIDLFEDAVRKHLRSDVPVGSYLSGGLDSSIVTVLANKSSAAMNYTINGRFTDGADFDESLHAKVVAAKEVLPIDVLDISADDFIQNIRSIIYHLDYPIAGPGSFAQFMVAKKAREKVKVMLGGQGGDELFGGYARYILMYFSEVVNSAIDNDLDNPRLKPRPEKLIGQLGLLKKYKPLFQQFMRDDFFASPAKRYYSLINRAVDLSPQEINFKDLPMEQVYDRYESAFNCSSLEDECIFNKAMSFDLKYSLPALLHVEDRVSMAHGLESRVPFLDHRVVEFSAQISPELKVKNDEVKAFLTSCFQDILPEQIVNRRDKMGFPVPINNWLKKDVKNFVLDILSSDNAKNRPYLNIEYIKNNLNAGTYSRKLWGILSLELWFQEFYDRHHMYKKMLTSIKQEAAYN